MQTPKNSTDIVMGTLTPYCTDYKNKLQCQEAFRQGKDFVLKNFASKWDNKPCSIRDCNAGDLVKLRYARQRMVTFYTVTDADLLPKGT